MKAKFILFLLFFLISINFINACVTTGPCQGGGYWCICGYAEANGYTGEYAVKIKDIQDFIVYKDKAEDIYLNYYFLGYNSVHISLDEQSVDLMYNIGETMVNGTVLCSDDNLICLYPYTSAGVQSIYLKASPSDFPRIHRVYLEVYNYSNQTYGKPLTIFNITFTDSLSSSYVGPVNGNNSASSDGFIGSLVNAVISVFPDSHTLTFPVKVGYVFVSMFLTFLSYYGMIYFLTNGVPEGISSFFHYVFFIMIIVQFFFFIGISYIPIGILIIVILIMAILGFFRFKSGFSSGGNNG